MPGQTKQVPFRNLGPGDRYRSQTLFTTSWNQVLCDHLYSIILPLRFMKVLHGLGLPSPHVITIAFNAEDQYEAPSAYGRILRG